MKRLIALLVAASAFVICIPGIAQADVNSFTITHFDGEYILSRTDPQGTLDITEKITVEFTDQNHGLLRALPEKYDGKSLNLRINTVERDGVSEPYTTYQSNGNEVLKIGNPQVYVTGKHRYDISYSVENVIRFGINEDKLIWNTNGTAWHQPVLELSASLRTSGSLANTIEESSCFTGKFRSTEKACNGLGTEAGVGYVTTRTLQPGENMTFTAQFPKGTFTAPTALDWWKDNGLKVAYVSGPILAAFLIGYRKWRKSGRDTAGRGTIVPEYAPPQDLRPAEAATILEFSVTNKAVSATVIDLAIRGFIRISETVTDGLLRRKKTEYTFEKLPKDTSELKAYEKTLLDGMFGGSTTTSTTKLTNSLYKTIQQVATSLPKALTKSGYFSKDPNNSWTALLFPIVLGILFAAISAAFSWQLLVGFAVGTAVLVLFAIFMPQRSELGVATKDSLEGLKLYLNTAEKDRIAMLQSPHAPYTPQSSEPVKTVELFEKLLPYAIVMGVEKQWAKEFEQIYTTPPDWYSGNWNTFNSAYLVSSLGSSMDTMNTSFAAPSTSSSGSGGSFSGGGGGGGGGGGW